MHHKIIIIYYNIQDEPRYRQIRRCYTFYKHRQIFSESCKSKPNLDYKYPFPIDLAAIGIPIGAISIGKRVITIQIWF